MKSEKIKKVSSILNGFLKLILDIMKKKEFEKLGIDVFIKC